MAGATHGGLLRSTIRRYYEMALILLLLVLGCPLKPPTLRKKRRRDVPYDESYQARLRAFAESLRLLEQIGYSHEHELAVRTMKDTINGDQMTSQLVRDPKSLSIESFASLVRQMQGEVAPRPAIGCR